MDKFSENLLSAVTLAWVTLSGCNSNSPEDLDYKTANIQGEVVEMCEKTLRSPTASNPDQYIKLTVPYVCDEPNIREIWWVTYYRWPQEMQNIENPNADTYHYYISDTWKIIQIIPVSGNNQIIREEAFSDINSQDPDVHIEDRLEIWYSTKQSAIPQFVEDGYTLYEGKWMSITKGPEIWGRTTLYIKNEDTYQLVETNGALLFDMKKLWIYGIAEISKDIFIGSNEKENVIIKQSGEVLYKGNWLQIVHNQWGWNEISYSEPLIKENNLWLIAINNISNWEELVVDIKWSILFEWKSLYNIDLENGILHDWKYWFTASSDKWWMIIANTQWEIFYEWEWFTEINLSYNKAKKWEIPEFYGSKWDEWFLLTLNGMIGKNLKQN